MPSIYAHYRFGASVIPTLPPQVQRCIRRFRPLYDVGLHGPDIFYFYSLPLGGSIKALGSKYHSMTGEEFFLPVCKHLRLEPNEAAMAYLYGVLTHYCLDSAVHGFVNGQTADGRIGHIELEAEFDRYLLQLDGRRQPNTVDLSGHLKLTAGECETAAKFYGATPTAVALSLKCMAGKAKLVALPNGRLRQAVKACSGPKMKQNFVERTPNRRCSHLNEPLLSLYEQALADFPARMEALLAHMHHNAPLSQGFDRTFNG